MLIYLIKYLIELHGHAVCHIGRIQRVFLHLDKLIQRIINELEQLVLGFCQHCDVGDQLYIYWWLSHVHVIQLFH